MWKYHGNIHKCVVFEYKNKSLLGNILVYFCSLVHNFHCNDSDLNFSSFSNLMYDHPHHGNGQINYTVIIYWDSIEPAM